MYLDLPCLTVFPLLQVMYFDVGFTKIHKPLWMTTGPRAPYTHWRQTVFYLHNQLTMNKVLRKSPSV